MRLITFAVGARRPAIKVLNETDEQQGAEGLENIRASASLSYSTSL